MKLRDQLLGFGSRIGSVKSHQYNLVKEKKKQIYGWLEKNNKQMSGISEACENLMVWVNSVISFYETNKKVEPLKANVKVLEAKLKELSSELAITEKLLFELNAELKELNDKFIIKKTQLDELTEKVAQMERKLNAATKLIDGLGGEQKRWTVGQIELKQKYLLMDGECLLCSSFLSYFGPFSQEFRNMITTDFIANIREKEIEVGEGFYVESLLTNDVEKSGWNSEGLPEDVLSVQNGILTTQASRYPLCIDPQLQAVFWIKKKEQKD